MILITILLHYFSSIASNEWLDEGVYLIDNVKHRKNVTYDVKTKR